MNNAEWMISSKNFQNTFKSLSGEVTVEVQLLAWFLCVSAPIHCLLLLHSIYLKQCWFRVSIWKIISHILYQILISFSLITANDVTEVIYVNFTFLLHFFTRKKHMNKNSNVIIALICVTEENFVLLSDQWHHLHSVAFKENFNENSFTYFETNYFFTIYTTKSLLKWQTVKVLSGFF